MNEPRLRALGTPLASLALAVYVLALFNAAFWRQLWTAVAPADAGDVGLVIGIGALLLAVMWTLFAWVGWGRGARPAWALLALMAALAAYFMDTYGLVIDRVAIQSVFETDAREVSEWINWRMLPYLALGALPGLLLVRVPLRVRSFAAELGSRMAIAGLAAGGIGLALLTAFQPLSSLARNHRELRHLINPTALVQASFGYARRALAPQPAQRAAVGADARLGASWLHPSRPRVLVLVIGESARASSFGVLGYGRDTTPRLAASDAIAYAHVRSCGTSTAVSLPCMFSDLGATHYSDARARGRETLLDVLAHAGLHALWLDNNTGSKHIAWQQEERFLAEAHDPRHCNATGCYDDLLADELAARLDAGDAPALVVLHQKGSHGPSYFERYPPAFRRFQPTCDSNELQDCSRAEIVNSYDNTILYTDHALGRVLDVLREREASVDAAMLYVSDHGESTGEHGFYLHGAPGFMAPEEQSHVPMLLWMSDGFAAQSGTDRACLTAGREARLSHDNLFHSVLGLLDVSASAYRRDLDFVAACRGGAGGIHLAKTSYAR